MAIKDETGNGAQETAMGAAMGRAQGSNNTGRTEAPRSPNPTGHRDQPREKKSFSQMGSGIKRAMPLSSAGEALARTQKAVAEAIEAQRDGSQAVNATLMALDPTNVPGLPIAYLVMCVQLVDDERRGVGYQPMIIDASLENITPGEITVNGQKVEVLRTAENADTDEVRDLIHAAVCDRFQTNDAFGAMALVVPKIMNMEDKVAVKNLATQTAFAAAIELQRHSGLLEPLNLTDFGGSDETLVTNLNFDGEQALNLVHLPVREDVKIDLVSEPVVRGQQNALSLGTGATAHLSHSSAFVDFVYQPMIDPNTIHTNGNWNTGGMGINPDVWRKFIPRVNFTDLRAERLTTLGGQLLALAAALGIRNNRLWMGVFAPNRGTAGEEVDFRDIGALNIEANWLNDPTQLGAPFDTKADNFTMGSLATFIDAVCHPSLLFSIDVSERGADTWYNGVWAAADEGDVDAEQAIIDAADDLTNGAFSKHFPSNAPVTLRMNETILMGYYKHKSGELRDVREIDYLALLNLYGQNHKDIVDDYSDTIVRTDYDEALRLESRMNIIRKATTNAVFTGRGRRVTCSSEFITAFTKAVEDTRISMPVRAPHFDTTIQRRAVGNYGAGAVSNNSGSSIYSRQTGPTVSGNTNYGRNFSNRWGN